MATIFHLSDLHIVENIQWKDMKLDLLNAIPDLAPNDEKLLIVTGDFHNFKESNYCQAIEFLDELIDAIGIDRSKDVFVVPGNHDVGSEAAVKQEFSSKRGWKTQQSANKAWKEWHGKQEGIVAWLKENETNNEERYADKIKDRLHAYTPYCTFVRSLRIYPDGTDFLPAKVHVRTWRGRLNLLHLNTTLVADDSGSKTNQQLDIITAKSSQIWDGVNTDLPALALGHNSFFDILKSQQEKLKDVFIKHCVCAYLCGDTHKEELSSDKRIIVLDRGHGALEGNIPNVVGIKAAPDPTDEYSDFGFYLHKWDENKKIVSINMCRWLSKDDRPRFKHEHGEGDDYHMPRLTSKVHPSEKGSSPIFTTHPDKNLEASLTLARVFKAVACQDIVAAWDDSSKQFLVSKLEDASPKLVMRYLGLNAELFDLTVTDIGDFVSKNRWNASSTFNELLDRYSTILGSIWNKIKSNISENIQNSLAVSTYCLDNEAFPKTAKDLQGYQGELVQPQGSRWNTLAKRICPCVEDVLKSSDVGADFFSHCNINIKIERAIDGVTALVLACLCYCQVDAENESTARVKVRYRKQLQRLIQDKFDFTPPDEGGDDPIAILQTAARVIYQNLPSYWTENKKIEETLKITYEEFNLKYRDDNVPQPPPVKSL